MNQTIPIQSWPPDWGPGEGVKSFPVEHVVTNKELNAILDNPHYFSKIVENGDILFAILTIVIVTVGTGFWGRHGK